MDFLGDFDFDNGEVDLSLVFGEEEDNLMSEICKELADSDVDLDQFDNGEEDDSSIDRGGFVEACKYGIGKRLEDIRRLAEENHIDKDDHVQPQEQHVSHIDDEQVQPRQQHVVEKPAVVELMSLNEEDLERKLEASKKKLHTCYQEADRERSKRKVQVLDLKDCPDLKRSKKCVGETTKRGWLQSSSSLSTKKKSTCSRFRGGRMSSCK